MDTKKNIKKIEDVNKEDLIKTKQTQLEDDKARIEGRKDMYGRWALRPIDLEIKHLERDIEKITIMIENDMPFDGNVRYRFEINDRYREILKEENREVVEALKETLERVKKQKVECTERIPKLEAEIKKLESNKKEEKNPVKEMTG